MDTTDPAVPAPTEAPIAARGSQSRLSPALFFVLLAALLFRFVTAVTDRPATEASGTTHRAPPLVRWVPLEKASAAAAAAGKPALYDFTAQWCLPCHRLDDEGWSDEALAGIANRGFVPARVMDREREEGKNTPLVAELQRKYNVESFPTLIVAGADGKEIARMEGWGGKDALEKFLKESKAKAP
jgi:thiol:disulfide interchange protein